MTTGFAIVPLYILEDKEIPFYDRSLYACMMTMPGAKGPEIAEEYGLDEAEVLNAMARWLVRGEIHRTEDGTWDFKPRMIQLED